MEENPIETPQTIMRQIIEHTRTYNEAIKTGKVFEEVKEIRQQIKCMARHLEHLLSEDRASEIGSTIHPEQ